MKAESFLARAKEILEVHDPMRDAAIRALLPWSAHVTKGQIKLLNFHGAIVWETETQGLSSEEMPTKIILCTETPSHGVESKNFMNLLQKLKVFMS